MHGVTTALVGFLLVCVVFPRLVKNGAQFYAGFGLICLMIFFDALGLAVGGKFAVVMYFLNALLQIGAICVLFLAAGGITWRELGGELSNAFEVIRRGEEEKEIIVPLTGEMPKAREAAPTSSRITLDSEPPSVNRPEQQRSDTGSSIPLE